ncbi:unnamed protein product, partial [Rotaria sp. Silwood2]
SNNGYYHQQPVLNDHHLLPMDTYHTNNGLTYPLQQQIDPNDDDKVYVADDDDENVVVGDDDDDKHNRLY